MSTFRFPPPPPPPPQQATQQIDQNGYPSRGGASRGHRGGFNNYNQAGRGGHEGQRGGYGMGRGRGGPMTGDKRKWSDRGGRSGSHPRAQHAAPPHSRNPHMSVAPAVPSFGFSLPSPAPSPAQASPTASAEPTRSAKRKHNVLGLTPKGPDREDSDHEVDEEAAFAAQLLVQSGGLPNTQNRVEMAAWLAERRKRYPTKARLEEKRKAAQEAELERLKQRAKASRDAKRGAASDGREGSTAAKSKQDRQREKLERHLRKAEKLRQRLAQGRPPGDTSEEKHNALPAKPSLLGGNYSSDEEVGVEGAALEDHSSSADSSSESDSGSDTSSLSSDNESAPEETSSKTPAPPVKRLHEASATERKTRDTREPLPKHLIPWVRRGFCKDFLQQKPCPFGSRCRNKHKIPQEVRDAKLPRKRLFDRLMEQEVHKENVAAVNAIKALGATGFLNGS